MPAEQCHPLRYPCAACVPDEMAGNGRCRCTSLVSLPQRVCDADVGRRRECEEHNEEHHVALAVDGHAGFDSSLSLYAVSTVYPVPRYVTWGHGIGATRPFR